MYVVPEDLREDVEHYNDKIERDRRRKNGAVLYRYSRRKINKQVVVITKITLVMLIGFIMLASLCSLSDDSAVKTQSDHNYQVYNNSNQQVSQMPVYQNQSTVSKSKQPIAYYQEYVPVPVYHPNTPSTSYTLYQPVNGGQNYHGSRSFTYTNR